MLRPSFSGLLRWSPGARRRALSLALLPLAGACAPGRPVAEASTATSASERIAELETRVARDRAILERYVSSPDAADLPDPSVLREIAWRLPDYQRELASLRGEPAAEASE